MSADGEKLFQLAINFRPFTEKDRVKRTQDTFDAIMKLKEYQEKIQLTLDKLTSGEVLSEKDANVVVNFNVPEVSSLIRPHATERQWKIRHDEVKKILKNDHLRQKAARQGSRPYKPHPRLENARAFKQLFVAQGAERWSSEYPSEAWYRYFESVYRSSEASELCTLQEK